MKRENSTNRRLRDEYRNILNGATKQAAAEPVDHWRLSLKPLNKFDTFPEEWVDDMKKLKVRVSTLKLDIHAVNRR